MPIEFDCPKCGRQYKIGETHAGKTFECKQCSNKVKVPGPKPEAAAPEPKPAVADRPVAALKPAPGPSAQPAGVGQASHTLGGASGFEVYKPRPNQDSVRSLNNVFLVGVGVILLGMILPWLSTNHARNTADDLGYVSGFQLPFVMNQELDEVREKQVKRLRNAGATYEQIESYNTQVDAMTAHSTSLYALFLIPILTALALVDELKSAGEGKDRWYVRLVAALSPYLAFLIIAVAFIVAAIQLGGNKSGSAANNSSGGFFDGVGIGFWVVLIGSIIVLFSVFTSPRSNSDWDNGPLPPPPQARPPAGPVRAGVPLKANRPLPKLPTPKLPRRR